MADPLVFEASANLQRLIGRELVPNEVAALKELVKNAYDSLASRVTISVQPETKREPGQIEVRDDGSGMSLAALRTYMWAGYSERPDQAKAVGTSAHRRIPTGEKGIGRFAADRLGSTVKVQTKVQGDDQGIEFEIDWRKFNDKDKKFSDIKVPYRKVRLAEFPKLESHGTVLRIERLRAAWNADLVSRARQGLAELLSPFHRPEDFTIDFQVSNSPDASGPVFLEAPEGADIELDFRIQQSGETKQILSGQRVKRSEEILPATAESRSLTGVRAKLFYFERHPSLQKSKGLSGGVRVYRDGFKVEPVGAHVDWLGLQEKRAKRAGHAHIVPSRLLGFLEITRIAHPDLSDTTSRQAFIETETFFGLTVFLKQRLKTVEEVIEKTISEPNWRKSREKKGAELEEARRQTLAMLSFGLAHELRQPLQTIRFEAASIRKRLVQLGIADPDVDGAQRNIDIGIERINTNISAIYEIARGNVTDITTFDAWEVVDANCGVFRARCAARGIELSLEIEKPSPVTYSRFALATVLLNLMKNAVESIEEARGLKAVPRITVRLKSKRDFHELTVEDNGPGVPPEVAKKLFERFATRKTGGMGYGLHYSRLVLGAVGGHIAFKPRRGGGATFLVTFEEKTL